MLIYIRTGFAGTIPVEIDESRSTTLSDLYKQIRQQLGCELSSDDFRILFNNKSLNINDDNVLSELGLFNQSTVELVPVLCGGKGKKKKKVYSTPKKNKHVKKKTQLAILKCYKVNPDGKVVRLRQECTNADCGAGVFMASHFNRYYCGKCTLTLMINPADVKK